jgi:Multiubiquitin
MTQIEKVTKVEIFVNRRKLELHQTEITGAQLIEAAGFQGEGWDLFKLQGEGDPTGGDLVQAADVLHLQNGDRFRVIPGNRTFGA